MMNTVVLAPLTVMFSAPQPFRRLFMAGGTQANLQLGFACPVYHFHQTTYHQTCFLPSLVAKTMGEILTNYGGGNNNLLISILMALSNFQDFSDNVDAF
ncbi:hypothetical protein H4582DRAFT_1343336 [Lactarius indigo]|nr:hypothetical protein H4582DRAFT_1343336 [Lactarius indigo]